MNCGSMKLIVPVLLGLLSVAPVRADFPVVARLKRENVRAVSAGIGSDEKASRICDAGLNFALTWAYMLDKAPFPQPNLEDGNLISFKGLPRLRILRGEAALARKHNLITMPLIWFHKDTLPYIANATYRRCVTARGKTCRVTPCPQDEVYWQKLVAPMIHGVAQVQAEEKCEGGVAIDQEFYVGDLIGGFCYGEGVEGCFCDACFGGFLESRDVDFKPGVFPLHSRYGHIVGKYGLGAYHEFLERKVAEQVDVIAKKARSVKEDLLLGLLPGASTWYLRGIARGMATPELPVMLFSETEYFTGFNPKSAEEVELLGRKGIPAFYVGGMTMSSFNAEGLGGKAAELADEVAGYWLYHGEVLFLSKPKIVPRNPGTNEYVLREAPERYLACLKQANDWISKRDRPLVGKDLLHSRELLTEELFPGGEDYSVCSGGLRPKNTHVGRPGKLIDTDFRSGLPAGWACEGGVKPVKREEGRKAEDGITIELGPDSTDSGAIWQRVPVPKKRKYRFSMEIRSSGVSAPQIGFQVIEPFSGNPYFHAFASETEGRWRYVERYFSPFTPEIKVNLVLRGKGGKVQIRNAKLEEVAPFSATSASLSGKVQGVELEAMRQVKGQLMNPDTGLAYHSLFNGRNDVRYLTAIYGRLPMAIGFSGKIAVGTTLVPIPRARLLVE